MEQCKSCGADIIWALTGNGKNLPVDAVPVPNGNVAIIQPDDPRDQPLAYVGKIPDHAPPERYYPHFATCKDADKWRKKK